MARRPKKTIEYLREICELMHSQGVHELAFDGIHIALHPRVQVATAQATPLPDVKLPIDGPTHEELLYWSAGGPPPVEGADARGMPPQEIAPKQ